MNEGAYMPSINYQSTYKSTSQNIVENVLSLRNNELGSFGLVPTPVIIIMMLQNENITLLSFVFVWYLKC